MFHETNISNVNSSCLIWYVPYNVLYSAVTGTVHTGHNVKVMCVVFLELA